LIPEEARVLELRICIDVPNLDRGIDFYTRALGLRLARRNGPHWAELLGAACPVDLLPVEAGTPASPLSPSLRTWDRHWTAVHLDLAVDDLEAAVARAEAAGARLERPIVERRWGRMANMGDPFGHGFCLLQFQGRGYDELLTPAPTTTTG
jgi:catechol 2,3-dioxygenase-like lactoylglutathione lyase family enzyme